MTTLEDLRELPGSTLTPRTRCSGCGATIVWAVTVAGPNGRGGKLMPLDPVENLSGNVAVRPSVGGRLTARVLCKEERFERPAEYAAMTHFASCPVGAHPEPPVREMTTRANQRRARARAGVRR